MRPISPVLPSNPSIRETVFAKDQPEYIPLPAVTGSISVQGYVTTRWSLTWRERLLVLLNGSVWLQQLTFYKSLQPLKLMVEEPDLVACDVDMEAETYLQTQCESSEDMAI